MNLPSKVRFIVINNISPDDAKRSNYVIYAHVCSEGIYVGMSVDPVKRWQEHCSDALNKYSHNYDDKFKEAIRKCGDKFEHYIVAVANSESLARKKEAAAIAFYGNNLNTKLEASLIDHNYNFNPIGKQVGIGVLLEKKGSEGAYYSRTDSARLTVIGEIYSFEGRKRLRTIEGQAFPPGLNIECPRDERSKFNVGDKVRVNVAMSQKANGTKYLVAAKTAKLVKV